MWGASPLKVDRLPEAIDVAIEHLSLNSWMIPGAKEAALDEVREQITRGASANVVVDVIGRVLNEHRIYVDKADDPCDEWRADCAST